MKTVVLGLFDDQEQAGGVLAQLVGSPLDLDTIEVVSHDLDSQRALTSEYGLDRGRRGVGTAVGLCAMLGGVAGYIVGSGVLAELGPLLTVSGGILLGALGGLVLGLLSETVRVPEDHSAAVLDALEKGATAIVVRTSNVPTAHAIGDLFRAGGSRLLDRPTSEADRDGFSALPGESDAAPSPLARETAARPAEEDELFTPPWRRGEELEADAPVAGAPTAATSDANALVADAATLDGLADDSIDSPSIAADGSETGPPASRDRSAGAHEAPAIARFRAPSAAEAPPPSTAPALSDDADIVALDLTPRFARSFRQAGLDTVGALATRYGDDGEPLKEISGIGPAAIAELAERLETLTGHRPGPHGPKGGDDVR